MLGVCKYEGLCTTQRYAPLIQRTEICLPRPRSALRQLESIHSKWALVMVKCVFSAHTCSRSHGSTRRLTQATEVS